MSKLAFHLRQGALKLKHVDLAFASNGGDEKFDTVFWRKNGHTAWGADILVPRLSNPAEAVTAIFEHPENWQFDCSQFVQVVNYYAWLQVLGEVGFNKRVHASGGIKIKPFMGSPFTARKHYYRREARTEWMRYLPNGDKKLVQQTCMKAWDIVYAAPLGSRVNFTNDRAQDPSWRFENTIKISETEFAAHNGRSREDLLRAGFRPKDALAMGGRNIFNRKDLVTHIYRLGAEKPTADYDEADKYIWVKEVEYHVHVSTPVTCRSALVVKNP
jgi:hypothetical protein